VVSQIRVYNSVFQLGLTWSSWVSTWHWRNLIYVFEISMMFISSNEVNTMIEEEI